MNKEVEKRIKMKQFWYDFETTAVILCIIAVISFVVYFQN